MTDSEADKGQTARAVAAGVTKKAALITAGGLAAAVALQTALWPDVAFWTVPAGVLFGSALGVINFRWLAYAVERVYLMKGTTGAWSTAAAAVVSVLKLSAIFVAIFVVIKWNIVNVFALVAGLSCCFVAILWQGMTVMASGPGEGMRM